MYGITSGTKDDQNNLDEGKENADYDAKLGPREVCELQLGGSLVDITNTANAQEGEPFVRLLPILFPPFVWPSGVRPRATGSNMDGKESRHKYKHLLKKDVPNRRSYISIGSDNFLELFSTSTVLIDRTDFIREVLELPIKKALFLLPSGVGKTMALTALRSFLEQSEGDSRRQLFTTAFEYGRKLNIATDEQFFNAHFGQYHVLFFSLASSTEIEEYIAEQIREKFRRNIFLLDFLYDEAKQPTIKRAVKRLIAANIECFEEFAFGKSLIKRQKWSIALQLLVELLKQSTPSAKATWIIVDDYDGPVTSDGQRLTANELEDKVVLLNNFVGAVSNAGADRCVMAGTYKLAHFHNWHCYEASGDRTLSNAKQPGRDILRHFGFSFDEFSELSDSYGVVRDAQYREDVFKFYNGERVCGIQLAGTWSLMKFFNQAHYVGDSSNGEQREVRHGKFPCNFQETALFKRFCSLFGKAEIAAVVQKELFCTEDEEETVGGYILSTDSIAPTFEATELSNLIGVCSNPVSFWKIFQRSGNQTVSDDVVSAFMRFLLASGFLINKGGRLRIPNAEIRIKLMQLLFQFHYKISEHKYAERMLAVASAMKPIIYDKQMETKELKTALQEFLTVTRGAIPHNEHHLHLLFEASAYNLPAWTKIAGDYKASKKCAKRPDLIVISKEDKVGIVVEFKYGRPTTRDALAQIADEKHKYITKSSHLADNRFWEMNRLLAMGVVLNENDKVDILLEAYDRNDNESKRQFLARCEEELRTKYCSECALSASNDTSLRSGSNESEAVSDEQDPLAGNQFQLLAHDDELKALAAKLSLAYEIRHAENEFVFGKKAGDDGALSADGARLVVTDLEEKAVLLLAKVRRSGGRERHHVMSKSDGWTSVRDQLEAFCIGFFQ